MQIRFRSRKSIVRIRIRTKMSQIHNTGLTSPKIFSGMSRIQAAIFLLSFYLWKDNVGKGFRMYGPRMLLYCDAILITFEAKNELTVKFTINV